MIKAKTFHPMRGDAIPGNKVVFSDSEILTIDMDGTHWVVKNESNGVIHQCDGAYALACWIVAREEAKG